MSDELKIFNLSKSGYLIANLGGELDENKEYEVEITINEPSEGPSAAGCYVNLTCNLSIDLR